MGEPINVTKEVYSIPRKFRIAENTHIVLWLLKDLSWAMKFRMLGVAMFIPTLALALIITWQTRKVRSELFHNLAVVFWITANGYWMICAFFWVDIDYLRYFTAIPFSIGLLFVSYYYVTELRARYRKPIEEVPPV